MAASNTGACHVVPMPSLLDDIVRKVPNLQSSTKRIVEVTNIVLRKLGRQELYT